MTTRDDLLAEFNREMESTRKHLAAVPDGKFDWKPHPKSFSLGALASHLAEIPLWMTMTLEKDELDLAPAGGPPYKPNVATTKKELLEIFDRNVPPARAALEKLQPENLPKPWSLLMTGKVMMTMPRAAVLRNFILNHNVHHRAQLGLYLRMNEVAVPESYGPTADSPKK